MKTQDLEDFLRHMSLVKEAVQELRSDKNPQKCTFYQSKLAMLLPGHRAQIPKWIADDFKGAGK